MNTLLLLLGILPRLLLLQYYSININNGSISTTTTLLALLSISIHMLLSLYLIYLIKVMYYCIGTDKKASPSLSYMNRYSACIKPVSHSQQHSADVGWPVCRGWAHLQQQEQHPAQCWHPVCGCR